MKKLSVKKAYVIVILSIVVTILLQGIWLHQLFMEENRRIRVEIDEMLVKTAQDNVYRGIAKDASRHNNFQKFLQSASWIQIRQGFDDVKGDSSYKSFSMTENIDSAQISLQFVFMKRPRLRLWHPRSSFDTDPAGVLRKDSLSLLSMKKAIRSGLNDLDINTTYKEIIRHYSAKADEADAMRMQLVRADYISNTFSYDLDHLYKYQLIIPSLNGATWFRIRYHLASSIFMLVLTVAAFFLIFKLLQKTKLYADAKINFTSNITHEIKTPLATVALAMESITKYKLVDDPVRLQTYLEIGQQEIRRLNLLVEKILNLDKISDQRELHKELADVQSVIAEVLKSMEIQFENAGAGYRFLSSSEPCFADIDRIHFSNVIYNLIENALKYTTNNLTLLVSCTLLRDRIIISFTDNGPGIAKEFQNKIFDRFFRVPQPGDRHQVSGSGLGLNYVQEIIHAHHGTVIVKSDHGNGSSFIINLPAVKHEF